jgi:hypothetical protein
VRPCGTLTAAVITHDGWTQERTKHLREYVLYVLALLEAFFDLTQAPLVLNTSFNIRGVGYRGCAGERRRGAGRGVEADGDRVDAPVCRRWAGPAGGSVEARGPKRVDEVAVVLATALERLAVTHRSSRLLADQLGISPVWVSKIWRKVGRAAVAYRDDVQVSTDPNWRRSPRRRRPVPESAEERDRAVG